MDSPESTKPTSIACETAPAKDSPVFSYISNLSPIQTVKAQPVTPDFTGFNSPPLVFTSPRLCLQNQSIFLKRAQFPQNLVPELLGRDEDDKNNDNTVEVREALDIQLSAKLVACIEKGSDSISPVNDITDSPTGCPEQFLTDMINMDSIDSKFSLNSAMGKSEYVDEPPDAVVGTKEILVKHDSEVNSVISEEIAVASPVINRQTESVHKENTPVDVREMEINMDQGDAVPVDHYPNIEHELPVDHALTNQKEENSTTKNVEAGQAAFLDQSSHLLSESMEIEQDNENFVEATGAPSTEPFVKEVRNDPEAFQHHGVRRRCLQFQDAQHKVIFDQPAQSPSHCDGVKSLSLETPSMLINANHDEVSRPMLLPNNFLNSAMKVPKPSGIGLHLNSVVNAGSGAIVNIKSAQGNLSIIGKNSTPMINSHLSDYSNCSSILSLVENVSVSTDGNMHGIHGSIAANSDMSLSTYIVEPSNNTAVSNSVGEQSGPGNKRKNIEKDGGSDEFNKSSPTKKRTKSSDSSDAGGCKNCNCKRNKCLKLYCDCFAAGIYCAESCACQDCFNRPEYEDTVLETRQKIESRNPLAFAPKIVQHIIEQPATSCGEDGTHFTPSSTRHKRGCNCKKSMCLKKYCVCYQANVGCSDGCRCEGCKNVYGRKGDCGMIKDAWSEEDTNVTTGGSFVQNCEMDASENGAYSADLFNPHNLTPPTPAFQFSNHGKDASKAWFPSGKYFQSPESGLTFVAPYAMSSGSDPPRNSHNKGVIYETGEEVLDPVSFEKSHYGNAEMVDQFSVVGPLSGIPNLQKWADNSRSQSFSTKETGSSLVWRSSPHTPMAQYSGTKIPRELEFDSELSNFMEDDTPGILKDNSTPHNAVKVSSPNKKRVSPPHGRQHESGSSSSAGLRTGRKFILKAVPSFPPLTPCLDSKTIIHHGNDPQNGSGDK